MQEGKREVGWEKQHPPPLLLPAPDNAANQRQMKLLFPTWCVGLGTHRKDETDLNGAISGLEGREGLQRELDRLEQ